MAKLIREKVGRSFGYEWTSMAYQEEKCEFVHLHHLYTGHRGGFPDPAAQYESWTDPFAVIMGLPIALLGVVIGVMVMNLPISVYTQIGVVLLIAPAAKKCHPDRRIRPGLPGCRQVDRRIGDRRRTRRLRPILMTSFAFILGTLSRW